MKILITGGAGFIGSHLTELLLSEGHSVTIIDNLCTGSRENISKILKNDRLKFVNVDIRDYEKLQTYFSDIDWVFHLAALADVVPSIDKPEDYYSTNVTGTFNVLNACVKNNVKKVLYAASSSCYGIPTTYPTPEKIPADPKHPYALTKYLGEQLVLHWEQVYKIPALSLRLFNVFGPRARTTGAYGAVFGVFLAQKLANKPLTVVGDGEQKRDFIFVTDVAKAFKLAAETDVTGITMNVGSGNPYSINSIVKLLKHDSINLPKRPGEPDLTFADIQLITDMLAWKPEVTFEEGVNIMLESIDLWSEAPVWNPDTIADATKTWFKYLAQDN